MLQQYRRTLRKALKSFFCKTFQLLAYLSFPSPVRVFFQKLKGVKIGRNVFLGSNVYVDDRNPEQITIKDDSFVTAGCIILAHKRDLEGYAIGRNIRDCPLVSLPVSIGKGVHIGMGSIILPGVTIGDGAIIGAGTLVNKDIPPYTLAVGVPAKVIKSFSNE